MKEKAEKLIAELEAEIEKDIYKDKNIGKYAKDAANLGRIGGLSLAIIKIKIAYGIAPYKQQD